METAKRWLPLAAVGAVVGAMVIAIVGYTIQTLPGYEARHIIKGEQEEISRKVVQLATDRMTLDDARQEQFAQAVISHSPGITCEDNTSAADSLYQGEVVARCLLTYNILEPFRFKARAKYIVRFEEDLQHGFPEPRRNVTNQYFNPFEPITIYSYSEYLTRNLNKSPNKSPNKNPNKSPTKSPNRELITSQTECRK